MQLGGWREQDAMRRGEIGFGVLRGDLMAKRTAHASLQPRSLTAIFRPGPKRFQATRRQNKKIERRC
jgi:hypothetical protein